MTDEEIHNVYLHMSGKAEGLVEATGKADFPVLFARAILEYERLTKDAQNMASKSTYKEQLETKDEPVAWGVFEGNLHDMFFTKEEAQEMAKLKGSHAEIRPLYTTPQRTWVKLTKEEINQGLLRFFYVLEKARAWRDGVAWAEEILKEKNNAS